MQFPPDPSFNVWENQIIESFAFGDGKPVRRSAKTVLKHSSEHAMVRLAKQYDRRLVKTESQFFLLPPGSLLV